MKNVCAARIVIIGICLGMFGYTSLQANTLEITNLTSGQITVTLQTTVETVQQDVPVNMNPILNDVHEPDPRPTILSFANNPIKKLSITRLTPNYVQTIYYDQQNTFDNKGVPGGLHNLDMTREGKMIVWKDYVEINNVAYSLTDLQSYVIRCTTLYNNLSVQNLDATQKQLDDLVSTMQSVKNSDLGASLAMQLISLQTSCDALANAIKNIQALQAAMQTIQDLQNTIAFGNNNMNGTNYPYQPADDSIERSQKKLYEIKAGLQVIMQTNPTGVVAEQAQALEGAIERFQNVVDQMQAAKLARNPGAMMMVPPLTNLQTVQST